MRSRLTRTRFATAISLAVVLTTGLGGCAAIDPNTPSAAYYRCDAQFAFWVRFMAGNAVVDAGQGREVLVPAGSGPRSDVGPATQAGVQRFANRRVAIDFFREPLVAAGAPTSQWVDRALVRFTDAALAVRCVREE